MNLAKAQKIYADALRQRLDAGQQEEIAISGALAETQRTMAEQEAMALLEAHCSGSTDRATR